MACLYARRNGYGVSGGEAAVYNLRLPAVNRKFYGRCQIVFEAGPRYHRYLQCRRYGESGNGLAVFVWAIFATQIPRL